MQFIPSGTPKDPASLGVLGYLIIVNKQIHSYQLAILNDYLHLLGFEISDTVIGNIIDGKDDSVSFASSLSAFQAEELSIQKDIFYILNALASVDNVIDDNENTLMSHIVASSGMSLQEAETLKLAALEDAKEIRYSNNHLFEKPKLVAKTPPQNIFLRFILAIVNFFKKLFGLTEKEDSDAKTLQSDVDYRAAIEQCALVATEDFRLVRPSYTTIIEEADRCIDEIKNFKMSLALETGISADVADIVRILLTLFMIMSLCKIN